MLYKLIFITVLILGTTVNQACQVPVFRYALERWSADFIKIQAAGENEAFYKDLSMGNIKIESKPGSEDIAAYLHNIPVPFFKGKMKNRRSLIESPLRTKIFKKLTGGTSALWILLKSGNAELDAKAEENLSRSLAEAQKIYSAKILEKKEDEDVKKDLLTSISLDVKFEYLSLDRSSEEESILVNMLLCIEPDLKEINQPMTFAIYGRGRCLPPLIGKGISRNNIVNEDCGYLCGACTCEIKEQNPGTDLLIAHDWEKAIEGKRLVKEKVLPAITGINLKSPAQPDPAAVQNNTEEVTEAAPEIKGFYNYLYILLLLPIAAIIIWRLK